MSIASLFKLEKSAISTINSVASSGLNRKKVFPIAIGFILGNSFAVPGQEVTDSLAYFRKNYQPDAESVISQINEVIAIDLDSAMDYIKAFYQYRVTTAAGVKLPVISMKEPLLSLFGMNQFFPGDFFTEISNDPENLVRSLAAAEEICRSFMKENNQIFKSQDTVKTGIFDRD